jgi:hypothetical protein
MKTFSLFIVLGLFALSSPVVAQNPGQDILPNKAHETVIDGKWEAKINGQDKPVATLEFKNENGTITGTVTQDGKPTEIKNGALDGTKLKFETRHARKDGDAFMTMSWMGAIVSDGDVQVINLTCAMQTEDGGPGAGDLHAQHMEARKVTK